jgi:hypothetical protein
MTRARYLISFPGGAMDRIPEGALPAVGEAAHAVVREAMDAGVFTFAGGLDEHVEPVVVAADRTVAAGTYPETKEPSGGFAVVDVPRGRQPWSGPRSSRPPVAVRKKSARSHETRSSDRTGRSFGGPFRPRVRANGGTSASYGGESGGAVQDMCPIQWPHERDDLPDHVGGGHEHRPGAAAHGPRMAHVVGRVG